MMLLRSRELLFVCAFLSVGQFFAQQSSRTLQQNVRYVDAATAVAKASSTNRDPGERGAEELLDRTWPRNEGNEKKVVTSGRKDSVSLVTSFWAASLSDEGPPHRAEIEAAMLNNMNNPQFEQIVVILDSSTNQANCSHFQQRMSDQQYQFDEWRSAIGNTVTRVQHGSGRQPKLTCVDRPGNQPTYYEMFKYATDPFITGDVVVVANADQAFDPTTGRGVGWGTLLKDHAVLVLSTWGYNAELVPSAVAQYLQFAYRGALVNLHNASEVNRCCAGSNSWDGYVFRPQLVRGRLREDDFKRFVTKKAIRGLNSERLSQLQKGAKKSHFKMNERGAEHAALHALLANIPEAEAAYGCSIIRTWHFHVTPKMHRQRAHHWLNERGIAKKVPIPDRFPTTPYQDLFRVQPEGLIPSFYSTEQKKNVCRRKAAAE